MEKPTILQVWKLPDWDQGSLEQTYSVDALYAANDPAVGMFVTQRRELLAESDWARSGRWRDANYALTRRVHGCRVGVLGMGRIGRAVAQRMSGFGVELHYSDLNALSDQPTWQFASDPVALARSVDVLFVALAASPATRHIVNADVIEALGPEGLLINVSRASNVDESALIAALESGRLGAAALDVFEGVPAIDPRFLALDKVLILPHCASGTVETRKAMGQLVRDNLAAHFAGEPLLKPV